MTCQNTHTYKKKCFLNALHSSNENGLHQLKPPKLVIAKKKPTVTEPIGQTTETRHEFWESGTVVYLYFTEPSHARVWNTTPPSSVHTDFKMKSEEGKKQPESVDLSDSPCVGSQHGECERLVLDLCV